MSVRNKYILRLHYNYEDKRQSPNLEKFPYNDQLQYQLFVDPFNANKVYHVIALYDEGFAGNYIPGSKINEKMSLYGSLSTRGYYYFDHDKHNPGKSVFSFLSIHPSKFNLSLQESLKFANGVIENTNGEIYADGYDDGVETGLVLLSHDKSDEINWPLCSKAQTYDYDFPTGKKNNCDVDYGSSCRKLIISKSDIDLEQNQQINKGTRYVIKPCKPIVQPKLIPGQPIPKTKVPVCIYEEITGNKIGELSNTYSFVGIDSTQPTPVKLSIGDIKGFYEWVFDVDYITLYRDETSGEFRYYFSNKNGEKTSNLALQAYCDKPDNCKMQGLNLLPNARTYMKSILTSAEIGDFQGTGTVDEAAISLNVTNTLKSDPDFQKAVTGVFGQDGQDANSAEIAHRLAHSSRFKRSLRGDDGADPAQVAEELVTNKADELGKAIFQIPSDTLGKKTITEYVEQDMPKNIAQDADIQQAVANELKNNPGRARGPDGPTGPRGPEGPRGQNGIDGAQGLQGIQGNPGPAGPDGQRGIDGKNADPAQVAEELVTNKAPELGKVLLHTTSATLKGKTITDYVDQDMSKEVAAILRRDPSIKGPKGDSGQDGRDADPVEVTHRLAHNSRFKRSLRGDDGTDGERGEAGTPGLPGPTGQPGPEGKQGPIGPAGQNGQDGRDADPVEVTHRLAHNARFKRSLKGDDGERGEQGDQGLKGDKTPCEKVESR